MTTPIYQVKIDRGSRHGYIFLDNSGIRGIEQGVRAIYEIICMWKIKDQEVQREEID